MCWISRGNVCVGSLLGNYVLDHSWETMCCISPWKLCVVSFGPQLLGPQFWFPGLARQGPWLMAHWARMCCITFGILCVASVLGNYVFCIALRRRWRCMTPGKLCVASPLGNYVLHHPWESMCCTSPGKECVASPLGNYVLHRPWDTMCCIIPGKVCVAPPL